MRPIFVLAFVLGCGAPGKSDPSDDFSGLGDEKSDSFSSKMKIVATLPQPSGEVAIGYSSSPIYRAIKLKAQSGDWIKVTVTNGSSKASPNQDGDPVTWLLDSSYKVIAKNDDATSSITDSQITARLKKSGTFYVVIRDYNYTAGSFTVQLELARASGVLLDDANRWFQFFFVNDPYDLIARKYQVAMSQMPQAAKDDANGYFQRDVGNATGYKVPYDGSEMYFLTGSAEEAYDAAAYDDQGRAIAPIAIGGDVGEINFSTAKPPSVPDPNPFAGGVDANAAKEARSFGFKQYWKCPDDSDVTVLGDTKSLQACWSACQAQGGAGCWFLDGTGGFARECRVCRTLVPVQESWANDWARSL
jgi:hypothetical protein